MAIYRRRDLVQAHQYNASQAQHDAIVAKAAEEGIRLEVVNAQLYLPDGNGVMQPVAVGDWLVFDPVVNWVGTMPDDLFHKTYALV